MATLFLNGRIKGRNNYVNAGFGFEFTVGDRCLISATNYRTLNSDRIAQANCKKLCLTHFYPPCDLDDIRQKCSDHFKGEIVLAEDMMQFEL